MCTYSMVGDHFLKKWEPAHPLISPGWTPAVPYTGPTKEQFQELIDLLKAAKKIDEATGQPDCEMEEKKQLIRDMAKRLGIEIQLP